MNCRLSLPDHAEAMSDYLVQLSHPYLQPITWVNYVIKEEGRGKRGGDGGGGEEGGSRKGGSTLVGIAQPCWSKGSLRDLIHGVVSHVTP